MFEANQALEADEDYKKYIQDLQPPPATGPGNEWELHFCKWWGWNWVKRQGPTEEEVMKKVMAAMPVESKKPEKKPLKQLCNSLCFKKKKPKKTNSLQDLYDTPSNSVVEDKIEQKQKRSFQPLNLESNSSEEDRNKNTQKDPQTNSNGRNSSTASKIYERISAVEEQIVKDVRKDVYTEPKSKHEPPKKNKKKEYTTSSNDECSCKLDKSGSSTEDSIEYINITCCPCCHPRGPQSQPAPPDKYRKERYTQGCLPDCKMTATQTENKERKRSRRRRRICVICCSCGQYSQPWSCPCGKTGNVEEKVYKKENREHNLNKTCNNITTTYAVSTDQPFNKESIKYDNKTPDHLAKKLEPYYAAKLPDDALLYQSTNKPINKFGMPSKNYSWINSTKSDIWDQFSSLKFGHEFSSPVSGKNYNLSPIKINKMVQEPSSSLTPLSVEDELQSLQKIDKEVKMDLKSRIMLDAVCDAILAKDLDVTSSIFLNEFTYPSTVTQTERTIKDIYKPKEKCSYSKSNQTSLDEIIFEDLNKSENQKINTVTNTKLTTNLDTKTNLLRDYQNVYPPQTCIRLEYPYKKVFDTPGMFLNYNPYQEHLTSTKGNNDRTLIKMQGQPLTRSGLGPTCKRSASPNVRTHDTKKAKLKEPPTLANMENTNISDIFKKIDEIVMRSKVNNEEIQNVLSNIPKKTFQFFRTWDVPKLEDQKPAVRMIQQEQTETSGTSVETIEKQDTKTKSPQAKKKKVVNRPSLIPKRVVDSNCNKKKLR